MESVSQLHQRGDRLRKLSKLVPHSAKTNTLSHRTNFFELWVITKQQHGPGKGRFI